MNVVLVELVTQGNLMGDPEVSQIVSQVFANKKAAQAYVAENEIYADRITYLTRQVRHERVCDG